MGEGLDKSAVRIRSMFARIAPRYDLLNRLLSGGSDIVWRRKATALLEIRPGQLLLDLCSGTGDLALEFHRASGGAARTIAADFTFEMLALGKRKIRAAGAPIPEAAADGLKLPFCDATFDGVAAAFGVRNFENLEKGLAEVYRVVRPGGRFLILEFAPEPTGILGPVVKLYLRSILPLVGRLISGDGGAYRYLPESMSRWPSPPALSAALQTAGFKRVAIHRLSLGIAVIHIATKEVS